MKPSDDKLPNRFIKEKETPYPGRDTVVPIEKMVAQYYKKREYGSNGGPLLNTALKPPRQPVKRFYCSVIMAVLGWFIPKIACRKEDVKKEVRGFPEEFTCTLGVWPDGPSVSFRRDRDRLVKTKTVAPDLGVFLKSIDAAWLMFTFQESTCRSEVNGRLIVQGELPHTCTFIRLVDKVEILLLPKFIAKRAVKKWEKVR